MKNLKKLIPAICMLLVSAIMLGTSTYAWFSLNRTVTATGMEVTAVAEGNLVINKNAKVPMMGTDTLTSFAGEKYSLKAMTNVASSGWMIPNTDSEINQRTGYIVDSTGELVTIESDKFKESTSDKNGYYKDYLVYVATASTDALVNQDVYAKIKLADIDEFYRGALSVAFYLNVTTADQSVTPDAILNYKQFTKVSGNTEVYDDTIATVKIGTFESIPSCAGQADGVPILMRVFFDGDLTSAITHDIYTPVANPAENPKTAGYYVVSTVASTGTPATYDVTTDETVNVEHTYYVKSTANIKYINSNNLPVNNCTLTVEITAKDASVPSSGT